MANDINGISGGHIQPNVEQAKSQASQNDSAHNQPQQAAPQQAAPQTDTVQLTNTAAVLQQAESRLASVPVVDSHKVEAVKSALEKGQYQVNPERVADKMIQLEGMLNEG